MASTATRTMRIKEIMTTDPVTLSPWDNLREAARVLDDNEISGAPVVDDSGRAIGVISKTDIMHHLLTGPLDRRGSSVFELIAEGVTLGGAEDIEALGRVEDAMTEEPLTVSQEENLGKVARLMADEHVHRVLVVSEDDGLLGIVTSMDILRVFPK